jgi:hypothetical protein
MKREALQKPNRKGALDTVETTGASIEHSGHCRKMGKWFRMKEAVNLGA